MVNYTQEYENQNIKAVDQIWSMKSQHRICLMSHFAQPRDETNQT